MAPKGDGTKGPTHRLVESLALSPRWGCFSVWAQFPSGFAQCRQAWGHQATRAAFQLCSEDILSSWTSVEGLNMEPNVTMSLDSGARISEAIGTWHHTVSDQG